MALRKRASATYDRPLVVTYNLGLIDYGNGNTAFAIKPPYGFKNGIVIDIHGVVMETFNQVTTPAYLRIGAGGDADKYAELNFGSAAITDAYNAADQDAFDGKQRIIDMDRDGAAGVAISQLEVVGIAPTGGTPAGQAHTTIVVGWF